MRQPGRASAIVVLCMLASTTTAYADCAWVQWELGAVEPQNWRPVTAFSGERACADVRRIMVRERYIEPYWDSPSAADGGNHVGADVSNRASGDGLVYDTRQVGSADSEETITVPAGTFRTLKIVYRTRRTDTVRWEQWYAPEARMWIRTRERREEGLYTRELTGFTRAQ